MKKIFTSGKIIRTKPLYYFFIVAFFACMHMSVSGQGFQCAPFVYQVSAPVGGDPSTLYSYNINTGTTTTIAALGLPVNATGYSTIDDLIWGWDQVHNKVVSIAGDGTTASYSVPNLPTNINFNVGDIINGSYLLLTQTNSSDYYVVDINPAHTNYLKLVDPTKNFALDKSPFGNSMNLPNSINSINVNDMAYNPVDGAFYGLGGPTTGFSAFKIIKFNPTNGNVTIGAKVTTGGISAETDGFGSTFFDAGGTFYVFANNQGSFYRITLSTQNAVKLSTTIPANNNDGAGCTTQILSYEITGNVFDDGNGLTDSIVNGAGTNAGGVNAVLYDNTTGKVAAISAVDSNGTFDLAATPGHNYTIYLTNDTATIGQTNTPSIILPASWVYTGEHFGTGAGSDGITDAILSIGTVNSDTANADFGIDQIPQALTQSYQIAVPIIGSTITLDSIGTSPNPIKGTDLEDGNYGNGSTFIISSLDSMKGNILMYNGSPVIAIDTIHNFDSSLLQIQFTENEDGNISFAYTTIDSAGKLSLPATYTITWVPILPVRITGFNGIATGSGSTLIWTTAEETNASQYIIQSSTDGRQFSNEGTVIAKGNSNTQKTYSYNDNAAGNGIIYYRLKIIDINGAATYSNIIAVNLSSQQNESVIILYPNPVNNQLLVSVPVSVKSKNAPYAIYSSNGSLIKSGIITNQAQLLDIHNIPAGEYLIRVTGDVHNFTKKFVKVN